MKIIYWVFFLLLAFFSASILFTTLGVPALDNWDEAWYGEVAKQMLNTGNHIKLMWNGSIFLDKPPLYMWIIVGLAKMFGGLSEFIVRFPSALAGFIVTMSVFYYASKKYGFVAGVIAFGSLLLNNVYIWRARSGNLDTLAGLWIILIYFLMLSKIRHKYIYIGLLLSFVFLTKAALVLLPAMVVILLMEKSLRNYLQIAIAAIVPSAIWLTLGYYQVGPQFVDYFLFHSDQNVGQLAISQLKTAYASFIYYALQRRLTILLLAGICAAVLRLRNVESQLLLLFTIPFAIFLSLGQRANNWYLVPIFPFISLLIGLGCQWIFTLTKENKLIKLLALSICGYIFFRAYTVNITPIINTYGSSDQRQSGMVIKELSEPTDLIVRLNQEYPSTIYYSDRQVIVYKQDARSAGIFIGAQDLADLIKEGRVKWFSGSPAQIKEYASSLKLPYTITSVNNSEHILYIQSQAK
jgi:4-amino-4-deoxy-L-arabinose transferase-like glycosyltransferase